MISTWPGFIFLSLFVIVAMGCSKEEHKVENKIESLTDIPKDIRVPLKLWDLLATVKEGAKPAKLTEKNAEGSGPEVSSSEEAYVFAEVKVELTEKNPGIVKDKSITIAFSRGGGEIDLANYLTGKQGSFFVRFDFPEWEEAKEKKVLFISHARKRKIDNQIFGSGCKGLANITNRFLKEMSKEGLKVNTTRNRHTSVLAGTFVLSSKKGGQNYLTQVTFTDSSNKDLLCQEK